MPIDGGALDQDAWTMQAIDYVLIVSNKVLQEHLDRVRRDKEKAGT